jgi:hypothetical protein
MNAANNLTLVPIGPAVADHDRQTMNELVTKQDLYNMGVHIDSNFGKVISQFELVNKQFEIVDSQFTNLRTDMNAGFDRVDSQISNLRTDMDAKFTKVISDAKSLLSKSTAANTLLMVAILSIDRWWR